MKMGGCLGDARDCSQMMPPPEHLGREKAAGKNVLSLPQASLKDQNSGAVRIRECKTIKKFFQ